MTVKGGLGSGSVEERYSVNIEDGLKNAGYEITTRKWLGTLGLRFINSPSNAPSTIFLKSFVLV